MATCPKWFGRWDSSGKAGRTCCRWNISLGYQYKLFCLFQAVGGSQKGRRKTVLWRQQAFSCWVKQNLEESLCCFSGDNPLQAVLGRALASLRTGCVLLSSGNAKAVIVDSLGLGRSWDEKERNDYTETFSSFTQTCKMLLCIYLVIYSAQLCLLEA